MSDKLPERLGRHRLVGVHEGRRVDNVTERNRFEVNPHHPRLTVLLTEEDRETPFALVEIDNTRERPDVILYEGQAFTVVTTRADVPRYRKCMTLVAAKKEE